MNNKYYQLGIRDARGKCYPLWSVLVAAEQFEDARAYQQGWYEVTGVDLSQWRDGQKR